MVYIYHSFLVHSSADGHLGCFHVLAMTNSAAMNIGVHVSLSDLVSLVCMPRSGIAGSYGSSISSFLCSSLHYPTPSTSIPTHTPWISVCINWKKLVALLKYDKHLHGTLSSLLGLESSYKSRWIGKPGFLN